MKLKWIERRRPKPKAVGSIPITRSSFATTGRVSSTEERLSYKQATRVRLLHPAPVLYPGIAQLAERAIDNREAVGSTPTPWTNFKRASPSGKAPGFQPGIAWVRIPPPAPFISFACGIVPKCKINRPSCEISGSTAHWPRTSAMSFEAARPLLNASAG